MPGVVLSVLKNTIYEGQDVHDSWMRTSSPFATAAITALENVSPSCSTAIVTIWVAFVCGHPLLPAVHCLFIPLPLKIFFSHLQ